MDKKKIFENVFTQSGKLGIKFSDFKRVYERTDFSDVDKKKLNDIYLWGDDSSLLDQDKSLMQALNIDTDDKDLMSKISAAIPAYSPFFQGGMEKKAKGIDLIRAQIDYLKTAITSFESKFVSTLTGKEEGETFKSDILGIRGIAGEVNIPQELVNKIAQVFSRATAAPLKPTIDEFVQSDEGKKLISLLEEIGANRGVAGTERLINEMFSKTLKTLGTTNIDAAMNAADNTDLEEITDATAVLDQEKDYITSKNPMSELELMMSMDPFVRLGVFYQLAIQEDDAFMDRIGSDNGVNYNAMIQRGKINDESLKVLFGRGVKTEGVKDVLSSLDSISMDIISLKWEGPESEEVKATLFIPAMQAVYVALLNFVVMKGLYAYLTKKTAIVAKTKAAEQVEKTRREEAAKAARTPSMMEDSERGKKIAVLFRDPNLKAMLSDDTLYLPGKAGYDPNKVKALKELVYYTFGGKQTGIDSVKNWDISKNPLDGNYDQFFSNIIRDIQTKYGVPPLRNGVGDGKIGPITKEFLQKVMPIAISELV
jgi:hypothetical protein